jgi:serine/threonine protein kinase/tetratricopeptide (TPR) repeat protein
MDDDCIGPYRIVEPLGRGSMGVVYRARHVGSEHAVALKTVRVPSPRLLESIRREVHALTRIRHPGVVRIVDNGVHRGRQWYAMDLLEGESLRRFGERIWSRHRIRWASLSETDALSATDAVGTQPSKSRSEDPPSAVRSWYASDLLPAAAGELRTVVKIVRRLCATLAFLHGEGFLNCDLKPENVLLVEGQPVIIDFGLSAHHPGCSSREALEAQQGGAGTIPYMSPEQIRGDFLDARSDLYSMGCLLYELLTGRPPFLGPPRVVMAQHLFAAATPPSELVSGVPRTLEHLVLKLLEKDLAARFGHADEVAAELAELGEDVRQLPNFPPARSYLYRPRFVGREQIVADLGQLRDRALSGHGALVLLGGESGVGKTRVAMELTRLAPGSRVQIVASESVALSTHDNATVGSGPLHSLRPFLQAVADCCQEGGPDVTEHLLGDRRSVLALYEPLLAQVPARGHSPPVLPLDVEASRQRLFNYLSETLARVADRQAVLLVLDDVGRADELSVAFLRSLTREYLDATPLFILCTYRSEEPSDAVAALSRVSHATHVTLPRLDQDAVRSMVGDMLALPSPPTGFLSFVAQETEGNPFFVGEYLRTAVAERLLYRDQSHTWKMFGQDDPSPAEYRSLGLPRSLRELIEQRLRRLSPAARQAGLAAAVLGRESDADLIREVAGLSDDAAVGAIDELLRHQVLEQAKPGQLRFVHDKLREVAYTDAGADRLEGTHGRAATALESRTVNGPDASRTWAILGHHFAAARRPQLAAGYFKLAADHARATHANGEAIRLYREAINQVSQLTLQLVGDAATWHDTLTALHEALADILSLSGQRADARIAYDAALGRAGDLRPATRARLCRKIGKTWETQHAHDEALRYYGRARDEVAEASLLEPSEARDEWIQVRIDEIWAYYWLNRIPEMDARCSELEPVIENRGSPVQRSGFLRTLWMRDLRRDRYVAREETVRLARSALAASKESGDPGQILADQFAVGFVLLFHQQLERAVVDLDVALTMAEEGGDLGRQARCLSYLSLAARMRGSLEETRALTARSAKIAAAAGMRDYAAAARANQAWLLLREGNADAAITVAREVRETWRQMALVFPFHWLAALPLLEATLQRGDLAEAISCSEEILEPSQQLLPGSASDALANAIRCWTRGDRAGAAAALTLALRYLEPTGYR